MCRAVIFFSFFLSSPSGSLGAFCYGLAGSEKKGRAPNERGKINNILRPGLCKDGGQAPGASRFGCFLLSLEQPSRRPLHHSPPIPLTVSVSASRRAFISPTARVPPAPLTFISPKNSRARHACCPARFTCTRTRTPAAHLHVVFCSSRLVSRARRLRLPYSTVQHSACLPPPYCQRTQQRPLSP